MGDRPRDQPVKAHGAISNRPSTSQIASSGRVGDADGGAGVAALLAENLGDEIGGAVHRRGQRLVAALDAEEAAEPDHARELVEVADDGLQLARAR